MKTFNFLQKKRERTDILADELAGKLFAICSSEEIYLLMRWLNGSVDTLPQKSIPPIQLFFEQIQIPDWVNLDRVKKGSQFYLKNENLILFLLGTLSLPYCYAAKNGVQVLFLSQRLQNDTLKRLQETALFVVEASSFDEENIHAWKEKILKIRLLHAVVRQHILQKSNWNNDWGMPINQEDMAGTNLSFSYIVLKGLRKLSVGYSQQEAENFLHLWNAIGYLLGIDEDLLPDTLQEAYWLDKKIAETEFEISPEGRALAQSLIKVYTENAPETWIGDFFVGQMRFLLGKEIADILAIPNIASQNLVSWMLSSDLIKKLLIPNLRVSVSKKI
jgi:hypothetical protein